MDLSAKADRLFSLYEGALPGASFAIVKNGELALNRSYGLAKLSDGTPIISATNFRLASLTKAFTAVCILKLVDAGKLHLSDSLSSLIPGLPSYADEITVRMMLGHTSGLGDYESDVPADYPGQVHEDYVVEKVKSLPSTNFSPGSRFQYSDTAYVLLAVVVERVSGVAFPKFMDREVFSPLGMSGSRLYGGEGSAIPNRAFGYTRDGDAFRLNDQSKTSATLGDGCIYSSVTDMLKWDRALASGGLISGGLLEEAVWPGRLSGGEFTEYGFGWFIKERRGVKILHHAGETAGFQNKFIRVPDRSIALIILTNRDSYDLALPRQPTEWEDSVKLLEYFDLL